MLLFPIPKIPLITGDSDSFKSVNYHIYTEIPVGAHVGAYGAVRAFHTHEGVDLYCPEGTPVYAMEDGVVVHTEWFTGPMAGFDCWNDTQAVMIEGASGVINYGEILFVDGIAEGAKIMQGELLGHVRTVLKKDKGRPMSMLHVELYEKGYRGKAIALEHCRPGAIEVAALFQGGVPVAIPAVLKNPTSLLMAAMANVPDQEPGVKVEFLGNLLTLKTKIRADGKRLEIVEKPNVVHVIVEDGDEVLFVEQPRFDGVTLELPAGHIDQGETPRLAAIREVREETGFRAKSVTPLFGKGKKTSTGWTTEMGFFFVAKDLVWDPLTASDTASIKVRRVKITDLRQMVKEDAFPCIKTVGAILMYLDSK